MRPLEVVYVFILITMVSALIVFGVGKRHEGVLLMGTAVVGQLIVMATMWRNPPKMTVITPQQPLPVVHSRLRSRRQADAAAYETADGAVVVSTQLDNIQAAALADAAPPPPSPTTQGPKDPTPQAVHSPLWDTGVALAAPLLPTDTEMRAAFGQVGLTGIEGELEMRREVPW